MTKAIILLMMCFAVGSVSASIDRLTAEIAKHPAPIRMPGL